ncbi:hypothetical protein V757_11185 [Pelistega indica]|uniref:Uncharacterized protein n=1 Tax=Pelistega indica TaxID=1414851 RepID=V8FTT9_9BURK|nr:hypothetical protein V757_11185 [Pelistega indica]
MKTYKQLTERQKVALSTMGKHPEAFAEIVGLLESELSLTKTRYETAKEQLVASGDGRPVCLHLRGCIEALRGVIDLFNSTREL